MSAKQLLMKHGWIDSEWKPILKYEFNKQRRKVNLTVSNITRHRSQKLIPLRCPIRLPDPDFRPTQIQNSSNLQKPVNYSSHSQLDVHRRDKKEVFSAYQKYHKNAYYKKKKISTVKNYVKFCQDSNIPPLPILDFFKNKKLKIVNFSLTEQYVSALWNAMRTNCDIVSIKLVNNYLSDKLGEQLLSAAIQYWPELTKITYSKNVLGKQLAQVFKNSYRKLKLTSISLAYVKAPYKIMTDLMKSFMMYNELSYLDLKGAKMSDRAIKKLIKLFQQLPLRHLNMSWVGISSTVCEHLFLALIKAKKLRYFAFKANQIFRQDIPRTVNNLIKFHKTLIHLDLTSCGRLDHTELALSLRSSECLLCIHISINKIIQDEFISALNDEMFDNFNEQDLLVDPRVSVIQRKLDKFCKEEKPWSRWPKCWIWDSAVYKTIRVSQDSFDQLYILPEALEAGNSSDFENNFSPNETKSPSQTQSQSETPQYISPYLSAEEHEGWCECVFVHFLWEEEEPVRMMPTENGYELGGFFPPGITQLWFEIGNYKCLSRDLRIHGERNEIYVAKTHNKLKY